MFGLFGKKETTRFLRLKANRQCQIYVFFYGSELIGSLPLSVIMIGGGTFYYVRVLWSSFLLFIFS